MGPKLVNERELQPPTHPVLATFARRLRELMSDLEETQSSLSRQVPYVSQQALSDYLTAKKMPMADVVLALAEHFGVSCDWLLGASDVRGPIAVQDLAPGTGLASARILRRHRAGRSIPDEVVLWTIPADLVIVPPDEVERIIAG